VKGRTGMGTLLLSGSNFEISERMGYFQIVQRSLHTENHGVNGCNLQLVTKYISLIILIVVAGYTLKWP
jgi:hypothetical protein